MKNDDDSRRKMLAELMRDMDISDVMNVYIGTCRGYSRRLLKFFRWVSKWIPLAIMVTHAYGTWEFSKHPRELFILQNGNTTCYLFIYFMVYIMPLLLVLSSRFFLLCWRYRIPFYYYLGVNSIHIGHGSIFTTNEMITGHWCLMIMTLGFYAYGFMTIFLKQNPIGKRICG